MPMELLVTLVLALPIAGFGLTALVGRRLGTRAWIVALPALGVTWASAMVVVSSALAFATFFGVLFVLRRKQLGLEGLLSLLEQQIGLHEVED